MFANHLNRSCDSIWSRIIILFAINWTHFCRYRHYDATKPAWCQVTLFLQHTCGFLLFFFVPTGPCFVLILGSNFPANEPVAHNIKACFSSIFLAWRDLLWLITSVCDESTIDYIIRLEAYCFDTVAVVIKECSLFFLVTWLTKMSQKPSG